MMERKSAKLSYSSKCSLSHRAKEKSTTSGTCTTSLSLSTSERAGQRLYLQALESKRKIEEARKNNPAFKPRLVFLSRSVYGHTKDGYTTSGTSATSSSTQTISTSEIAGQRLYLQALESLRKLVETRKQWNLDRKIPTQLELFTRKRKPTNFEVLAQDKRYLHLYSFSSTKQKEGKERREEIRKSKLPKVTTMKKLPLSEATNMYDRGIQFLVSKELRREQLTQSLLSNLWINVHAM